MKREFSESVLQLKQELAYRNYSSRTITNYCESMMGLVRWPKKSRQNFKILNFLSNETNTSQIWIYL